MVKNENGELVVTFGTGTTHLEQIYSEDCSTVIGIKLTSCENTGTGMAGKDIDDGNVVKLLFDENNCESVALLIQWLDSIGHSIGYNNSDIKIMFASTPNCEACNKQLNILKLVLSEFQTKLQIGVKKLDVTNVDKKYKVGDAPTIVITNRLGIEYGRTTGLTDYLTLFTELTKAVDKFVE